MRSVDPLKLKPGSSTISDKLSGGYYTPSEVASVLTRWAVRKVGSKVLEPSCGDGQFIEALVNEFGNSVDITGVELFPEEAVKATTRGNRKTHINVADAFHWFIKERPENAFDAVVGNPPFIRYQSFPENQRELAFQIMQEEGLSPSRLTNAWLPFVVLATRALKPGGRLAFVLPAELLQVSYAREIRKYLSIKYSKITIVTFKKLIFSGIQQETVFFLGERAKNDTGTAHISFREFNDLSDLETIDLLKEKNEHTISDIDHDNEKWTQFYLTQQELDLVRKVENLSSLVTLGEYADVEVGVVTGNNDFFVLGKKQAEELNITKYCAPILPRSNQLQGISFTREDHRNFLVQGERNLLLKIEKNSKQVLDKNLLQYIKLGEDSGVTQGYKCRIRLPHWWQVPSVWIPDAFMLRQIHEGPRIVANETMATSTDTVHRVRLKTSVPAEYLAFGSINSLTFAVAELKGRSYGGGVLELEPSEAEDLLIPRYGKKRKLPIKKMDALLRQKKIAQALDLGDEFLAETTSLSKKEISALRKIWLKLQLRRRGRNKISN